MTEDPLSGAGPEARLPQKSSAAHPSMAELYRTKVEALAAALQHEDTRLEASETLRELIVRLS